MRRDNYNVDLDVWIPAKAKPRHLEAYIEKSGMPPSHHLEMVKALQRLLGSDSIPELTDIQEACKYLSAQH
jgi:hypothetical protein